MGKGKPNLTTEQSLSFVLAHWDGKKATFPAFRKEVTKLVSKIGLMWIIDAGRALFNRMQTLQEEFKKKKKTFKCNFADHDDDIWAIALTTREYQCVRAQLNGVRVDALKDRFGLNFTEYEKCGFEEEDEHKAAIENALELKLKEMIILLLNHFIDVIFGTKREGSSQKDFLRKVLQTSEIKTLMDGGAAKGI